MHTPAYPTNTYYILYVLYADSQSIGGTDF